MDSIISTFHIDWKIIIAQALNFAVVFVVLYIFALKPLSKLMSERSDRIAKGITDAKENKAMLDKSQKDYESMIQQARMEVQKISTAGKKEVQIERDKMMEEAKAEVANILENGKKSMEREKVKMVEDVKKDIISLAVLAAEKIIKEKNEIKNL